MKKQLHLLLMVFMTLILASCGSDSTTPPESGGTTYKAVIENSNLSLAAHFTQGPFGRKDKESILYWEVRDRNNKFVDLEDEGKTFIVETIMQMAVPHGAFSIGPVKKLEGKGRYQIPVRYTMKGTWDMIFKIKNLQSDMIEETIIVKMEI